MFYSHSLFLFMYYGFGILNLFLLKKNIFTCTFYIKSKKKVINSIYTQKVIQEDYPAQKSG